MDTTDTPHRQRRRTPPGQCVWLGNLPWLASEGDVLALMRDLGLQPQAVRLSVDEHGRSKGYCHCDFGSQIEAADAMTALNEIELGGRKLVAQPARN